MRSISRILVIDIALTQEYFCGHSARRPKVRTIYVGTPVTYASRMGPRSEPLSSTNGDFVIHFHHPSWRANRDDPSTATRVNERKVR